MLHHDRRRAESFGEDPDLYDRARPSYPAAMIDDVLGLGATGDGGGGRSNGVVAGTIDVLDVGCGTGIAARMFAGRGCHVTGVEPDGRMADVARRRGLRVELATFEEWDADGRRFDLLICGQAWHWVDPVAGAVKAATVIRPGGRVALFWNAARHAPEVRAQLDEIYARLAPGLEAYSIVLGNRVDDRFTAASTGLDRAGGFGPVERRTYPWETTYSTPEWLEHLQTHSDHRGLPVAVRGELLSAIGAAIDERGGQLTVYYDTTLVTAERL